MSFLRFKQSIINRLSPQNANKNYLLPNRRFNENSIDPLPVSEFEFRNATADSAMVLPYNLDPDLPWQVSFEIARIYNQDNQPLLNNSALEVTLDNPASTTHNLRVAMFGTGKTFTEVALQLARWYQVTLINTPSPAINPTSGALQVYLDGQLLGTINYGQGAYAPMNLVAAGFTETGTIAAFRGVLKNLRIGALTRDQFWPDNDGSGTVLKNHGTNPAGNGTLVNGSNAITQWCAGSCSVLAFRYTYSATDVADGLELDLDRVYPDPASAMNLNGVVIKWMPTSTILTVASVSLLKNGRTIRFALQTPQALAAGEGLRLEYTRQAANNVTIKVVTIAYSVPRATFFFEDEAP